MKLAALVPPPGYRRHLLIRRVIALALVAAAGIIALVDTTRTDPTVVVFARDLKPGETVTPDDVRYQQVPASLIPAAALRDVDKAHARLTVTASGKGEIVTTHRLTGAELLDDLSHDFPTGTTATIVPVRLADPGTITLLRHGDRVTIVTADADTGAPVVVAHGGRIVVADPDNPQTVLVALAEDDAHEVAAVSLSLPLGVVLTPAT